MTERFDVFFFWSHTGCLGAFVLHHPLHCIGLTAILDQDTLIYILILCIFINLFTWSNLHRGKLVNTYLNQLSAFKTSFLDKIRFLDILRTKVTWVAKIKKWCSGCALYLVTFKFLRFNIGCFHYSRLCSRASSPSFINKNFSFCPQWVFWLFSFCLNVLILEWSAAYRRTASGCWVPISLLQAWITRRLHWFSWSDGQPSSWATSINAEPVLAGVQDGNGPSRADEARSQAAAR